MDFLSCLLAFFFLLEWKTACYRSQTLSLSLSFFFNKFIYLVLAVLGLRCYARVFFSCGERGLCFVAVHGLLIAVVSFAVEHRL